MGLECEQRIECQGCGSIWLVFSAKGSMVMNSLLSCPLCVKEEEGDVHE